MGRGESDGRESLELAFGSGPSVRLLYLEQDGRFLVMASKPLTDWSTRALGMQSCQVRLGEKAPFRCGVTAVSDPRERRTVREAFRAKYGDSVFGRYFATDGVILALDPARSAPPADPAEQVEREFDAVAPEYASRIAHHAVDRYLKERGLSMFRNELRGRDPLLEIGPGTGYHTLPLLADGHRIVAVDLSAGMLGELRRRAAPAEATDRLTTLKGRLADLETLTAEYPPGYFSGVFSAFGAFNLESDLSRLGPALERLLGPRGRVVFTALNRPGITPCLWELALGRLPAAFARFKKVLPAGGIRYPLDLYLRKPAEWDRVLGPGFRRIFVRAVSVLAPPFDSPRIQRVLGPSGVRWVVRIDGRISQWGALWPWAEWLTFGYEKVGRTS
jgi:SAM-dependent methyltransferase